MHRPVIEGESKVFPTNIQQRYRRMISQAGSFQEDLGFPSWPMIWVFLLLLPQTDRKLSMCDMSKVHIFCHVKNVNGRGPVVTTGNLKSCDSLVSPPFFPPKEHLASRHLMATSETHHWGLTRFQGLRLQRGFQGPKLRLLQFCQ